MNIVIKILKGKEIKLKVNGTTSIFEIKLQIEKLLKYPVIYQKIILNGRPLTDDNKINSYPAIGEGSKLILLIKKPDPLKDVMIRGFRKTGFTEQQAYKLAAEFMRDFNYRMNQLSLDDIERIAVHLLQPTTRTTTTTTLI